MENPPFWWYLPGKMVIFMGYVSFREGNTMFWNIEIWAGALFPQCQDCLGLALLKKRAQEATSEYKWSEIVAYRRGIGMAKWKLETHKNLNNTEYRHHNQSSTVYNVFFKIMSNCFCWQTSQTSSATEHISWNIKFLDDQKKVSRRWHCSIRRRRPKTWA